jgi:hypothetical protein
MRVPLNALLLPVALDHHNECCLMQAPHVASETPEMPPVKSSLIAALLCSFSDGLRVGTAA